MTRILIAGGTGLIGRALAESLIRDGVAVDCPHEAEVRAAAGYTFRYADLETALHEALGRPSMT